MLDILEYTQRIHGVHECLGAVHDGGGKFNVLGLGGDLDNEILDGLLQLFRFRWVLTPLLRFRCGPADRKSSHQLYIMDFDNLVEIFKISVDIHVESR